METGSFTSWLEIDKGPTPKLCPATFWSTKKELKVVLPISFFEKDNNAYFNSIVIL